jgi:serine phosphatase RsbU (regulator of sigma subunit)
VNAPDASPTGSATPTPARAPAGGAGTASPRRRRPFLRAFLRALSDPRTFELRKNPSLWLGMILAIPIPLLVFYLDAPAWVDLIALVAPVGWGLILGAAGRVALLAEEDARRIEKEAAERERVSASAQQELAKEVATERKARKEFEDELKLAQAIQRTLVPPDLVRSDLQVIVRHIPSSFVGGDYLQAYLVRPDLLYLVVGDVSGHGVAAALVVNRIHGHVRRLILEQKSPDQFLEELNRSALKIFEHTYFFLTLGVFRVDLARQRIDYATAGHPAQFLLRADGSVESLSTPNRLLGMDADVFDPERPVDTVTYGPGDSLVLFTDGLFEILDKDSGELLGEHALQKTLSNLGGLPPSLVVGEVLHDLADFQGTSKFDDDVSLMVARFDAVPAPSAPPTAPSMTGAAR